MAETLTAGRFISASEFPFVIKPPIVGDPGRKIFAKYPLHISLCVSDEACAKHDNVRWDLGSVVEAQACFGEVGYDGVGLDLDLNGEAYQ